MGSTVRRYRFIDRHRIGETESWLSDMAAGGLHLTGIGPLFARFVRGEPAQMRYRVDFTRRTPESEEEQRTLYAESGWEYVCKQSDLCVFRSPADSGAPELHTDPAEQAHTLQRLTQKLTMLAIVTALLYAATLCMVGFAVLFGKTPVLTIVEGAMPNLPFLILLSIYGSIYAINVAISIRKQIRSLREGCAIDHRANWKRLYRSRMAVMLALGVMTPVVIGLPFAAIVTRSTEELPLASGDQMYLRLAEIEQDPALERKVLFTVQDVDWGNSVTRTWSPYAPVMLELRESGVIPGRAWGDGGGVYSPSMDCQIYWLRFSWLADGLVRDLCRKYEWYRMAPIEENTEWREFDRLYTREEGAWREVYASRGGVVVCIRYAGEASLSDVIEAAARLPERP